MVVETPRGARAKLSYDPKLKTFVLSKSLILGLSYPYDWGFIPSTRAEDGDPLDALVIHDAATYPGLVMRCKLLGVLKTLQQTEHDRIRNDCVIAVPEDSAFANGNCMMSKGFCRRSSKSWKSSLWPLTSCKPRH